MKMRVINNIFFIVGSARFGGFEVQTFWFRVLSTTLLQPLRSVPCLRCGGPEERAAEVVPVVPVVPVGLRRGGGGGFGRSCRAVDGEAGRGGTGRLSRGRRRSCRACCSVRPCREAEACRMEGPGWLSRVVAQDGGGCVGRSRWAAEVSGGGGHVGRRMERPNGDGPGGVGDLLCRMRAVGACPCPCPCLPANRMSAAEKRRRNLSLPARKRIFEGH